jgi:hypothetical protein
LIAIETDPAGFDDLDDLMRQVRITGRRIILKARRPNKRTCRTVDG